MLTSGFFESVGVDRAYDTNSFNTFFEGVISSNGVFDSVGNGFSILPSSGLSVNVHDGKALVNNHWVRSDAIEVLTLDAPNNVFNRYDMITLRWDGTTRDITLELTSGTASSAEEKPEPLRTTTKYEIVLAYIHVQANATTLTELDIIDCRYDTELCGIITGLISQLDTTGLYRHYASLFERMTEQMQAWQNEQQIAYDNWFKALTDDLTVNTKLTKKISNYLTTRENGTQYIDIPSSLNYVDGDILEVFLNGVLLVEGVDYDLTMNEVENIPMIYLYADVAIDNMITFYCLKNNTGA